MFFFLFVTEVHCTVSMVLSGDLGAPRTDLDTAPEVCPAGSSRLGSLVSPL